MEREKAGTHRSGFTLIELMIVVAIIGILAAVAIPKFADLIRKSKESSTKGNLGAVRSAIAIYYADLNGNYPTDDLSSLTVGQKYMIDIPSVEAPNYHSGTFSVATASGPYVTDAGGWGYVNYSANSEWGTIVVNCSHTDTKSTLWYEY